jgi:hypothetical protein
MHVHVSVNEQRTKLGQLIDRLGARQSQNKCVETAMNAVTAAQLAVMRFLVTRPPESPFRNVKFSTYETLMYLLFLVSGKRDSSP